MRPGSGLLEAEFDPKVFAETAKDRTGRGGLSEQVLGLLRQAGRPDEGDLERPDAAEGILDHVLDDPSPGSGFEPQDDLLPREGFP